ncbi:MAG: flagellar hook-associated protein FlgL [Candidatus Nitricoxidivorans perseverans]|uniref:Flagellar hook-associated protein FlgL n=1 Tax=Candidatus Nitricoxidivorans perseverans TaxID=2975601 RepID=A0AA49IY98_9PROT|nr:MAG: flagellar hook-associated protein FlgL [Candidatus Nitricoxidivorans perseverans]
MIRVSTGMIYDAGVGTINSQTASLLHLQQQVATGRRILKPSDDPVNAARALVVTQAKDIVAQYAANQGNAVSALGLEEAQLTGVNDLLARVKELTVQAGNSVLAASDRRSIALELRARFDELLGIANATDGVGQYIFSGYMGDTKPFGATVDQLNAAPANEAAYLGDDGQRRLQVSPTRLLEVSDSGSDVFKRIKNGNGTFATNYASANTGTGVIDAGSLTGSFVADTYTISFAPSGSGLDYTVTGAVSGVVATGTYRSGQVIAFGGASVTITGAPAAADTFTVAPSTSQSLFKTLANLIGTLERSATGGAAQAKFAGDIGSALINLDQANENILRVRTMIGARLSEIDSLASINEDLMIQYDETLSGLQDLDYAKAISDMQRKQLDLEAAQKSFMRTSQLSLFSYM